MVNTRPLGDIHSMMEAKAFVCLILSYFTITTAKEMHYSIRPAKSQSCVNQYSNTAYVDTNLTLSQFINHSSDYLTNDTTLILAPGNYSLESELVVESAHSFSMFGWSSSSSKAVITCGPNARFEFRNISFVTVSGLKFIGCYENQVVSVTRFQLENSGFFGTGNLIAISPVLIIIESTADINGSKFVLNVGETTVYVTDANLVIDHSTFTSNIGSISVLDIRHTNTSISHSDFIGNKGYTTVTFRGGMITSIDCGRFINNTGSRVLQAENANVVGISHSEFIGNEIVSIFDVIEPMVSRIDRNEFINITEFYILYVANTNISSIIQCEFIDNSVRVPSTLPDGVSLGSPLLYIDAVITSLSLNKFISNIVGGPLVYIRYYTTAENLTNNVYFENMAGCEVYIDPGCRPGRSLSLGSSRCIQCSENWLQYLIGIVVAAFIAGIVLVILMLALNMTVAVGTLNGILFYANIVAANADTFYLPFSTLDFVTVFISWLNLDIGFDTCFFIKNAKTGYYDRAKPPLYKALLQLAFPAYVIIIVIIVIVASKSSSKFAKLIGKGNPVAVLATMILLSYTKFFYALLTSSSLLYLKPAHGSRNLDITKIRSVFGRSNNSEYKAISSFLLVFSTLIFILCIIFTALVFSWQWLLQCQDKVILKWVRCQKLCLFLEPYHAPYTAKNRYWTGLLLVVRVFLYLISFLNFSLDPRVNLMSIIFVVGGLLLLKGAIVKRVYKNWLLDVMEITIYFNLVAFSALTWYNLNFSGNQVAVAYTSVMIIFILLVGVIVYHVLRYTWLFKLSFVEKAFKWVSSKLLEKKPKEQPQKEAPEELDGYQLERSVAERYQEPPTYSVVEISQSAQN